MLFRRKINFLWSGDSTAHSVSATGCEAARGVVTSSEAHLGSTGEGCIPPDLERDPDSLLQFKRQAARP